MLRNFDHSCEEHVRSILAKLDHAHTGRKSRFNGTVEWTGTVEWNGGTVEWWNSRMME